MSTDRPLTEDQLRQLQTQGWFRTRMFTPEDAAAMEDMVWRRLEKHGVVRDDPTTWSTVHPSKLSHNIRKTRLFQMGTVTDEFRAVCDQLLGENRWTMGKDPGMLLYTFPQDLPRWDVTHRVWHWHGDPMRNVDGLRDLFVFSFLNKVEPEQGGTLILEGSHHVVCEFMAGMTEEERQRRRVKELKRMLHARDPWLKALISEQDDVDRPARFMHEPTEVLGHPLRVVELTGEPGEAIITNMSVMHTTSMNASARPRFMRAGGIQQKDAA